MAFGQADEIHFEAANERGEGSMRMLRGNVVIETRGMTLKAQEVDYDEDKKHAEARGDVSFTSKDRGETLRASRAEYNIGEETGKFFDVKGSSPAPPLSRPGVLRTDNPFLFEGEWAEKIKDRYILHNGWITDCKPPNYWWKLHGQEFDIIPNQRVIARKAVFRIRWVPFPNWKPIPLVYVPYFRKPLEDHPRKSGFLTPNIGHSSRRGNMIGGGYFWAINRSYDTTYRAQYFSTRGFAHNLDFRAIPSDKSEFDMVVYGVQDKGLNVGLNDRIKQGGYQVNLHGKALLSRGFEARGDINYLSSFVFRQAFTESFNEAVQTEVRSQAYVIKHWNGNTFSGEFQQLKNYQSGDDKDRIVIRKLPSVEFQTQDREIFKGVPIWVSLNSSVALMRRNQPLFQTRRVVDRIDFAPQLTTSVGWQGFRLTPSFGLRETNYGSSFDNGLVVGSGYHRSSRELSVELELPSLARVFENRTALGDKLKHVIEPRAGFRWVSGIRDFKHLIRFDETELLTNTKEFEYSLTNRLYTKRNGAVHEIMSWQLWQKRYLDPTLGGAVVDGQRNVFATQAAMTGYAFFDQARAYSPIVSSLQFNPLPAWGAEWRSDYDPMRGRVTNSNLNGNFRKDKMFISAGHNLVRSDAVLTPNTNQFIGTLGWGDADRKGWSAGFQGVYDFRRSIMQFATTQVSFNSDCCGVSIQYRRFNVGTRNEGYFRAAFAISNIGSFGTLRRQERVF